MFRLVGAPLVVGYSVPPLELLHSGLGPEKGGIEVLGLLRLIRFLVGGMVLPVGGSSGLLGGR